MLKKFLLFTIASLVMLPALAAKPLDKPDKGNKGGGAVPLDVVFCPSNIDGGVCPEQTYRFTGDGEEYIDGSQSVSTAIDKFRFGLNVTLSPERNFSLDLNGCQENCGTLPVGPTIGWNVFATSPDGAQYLKMKMTDAPKPVNFSLVFFDTSDQQWSIKFNPSECPGATGTDTAYVTKFSDDTWVFEAAGTAVACLYFREGPSKDHTFNGLYSLPFKIFATAK